MAESKMLLNQEIGRRIQFSREYRGLTQEQLAERISRSTQFVSTIERGKAGASLETIVNLCEVLHTSADWLLRGIDPSTNLDYITGKLSAVPPERLFLLNRLVDDLLELMEPANAEKP